jgi:multiple sugar transport system substrate-binding protein
MKTKNLWFLVGALLVLALVLAACGGTQPATQEPAPTTETVVEEAPPTEAPSSTEGDGITLRWRTRPDNQAEIDVYQSVSDSIDIPGVTLVYEPGGSETASYQDVLKTELAAGTAPDVFWIPGTDVADFVQRGLLYNLRDLADATDGYADSDFYEGPMFHLTFNPETSTNEGVLWGLPRDVSAFALYLNLDLLAESGARDPRELAANGEWNWDTFIEVATAINSLGGDIRGYGQNAWWGPYGYWINAAGGGFFNDDRTACALDTPESLAGLDFERRIYQEFDVAVPYGVDSEPPFLAGQVGMFQNGRWATPGVRSSANFEWDVVKLPDGPAGPSNWLFWGAYAVNANTAHPEEAWQLLQELTSATVQGQVAELGANIPSRVSDEAIDAFLTFSPPANNQAFIDGLAENPDTEGPLWAGNWPEFDAIMGPAVQSVLNGEMSIDDFAATICDEANKTFTTPAVTAPPPAAEGDGITLRWRTRPDNQAEIDVYQSVSDSIDIPGVTLVYEPGGSETASYQDVLKTELAAGTAPDVFWIPGTDVADFVQRGLLYNLRDLADATDGYADSDFYEGPMFHLTFNPETSTNEGVLWGLPRDVSAFALYLNLDLLAESGARDPRELAANGEWNWDTFIEVATAINSLGGDIRGYGQNAWWGPYGYWINAAGGGFFNDDRTACALDTPESLAGLDFERRIYQEFDVAVPYGVDSEPPFLAGQVGMFQNGRWATPGVRSSANFEWDVVKLPDGPAGPSNWLFWGAYAVNANTAHPEEAWQLLQELTSATVQGQVAELGANIPSRVSDEAIDAFLTFSPPANNQAFIDGLAENPDTEGPLWAGNWPEFDAIMGPAVQSVLNGEMSIDDFAGSICDEANKAFTQ